MSKPQRIKFRLGDMVEWESQAHGKVRKKIGIVMDIIPAKVSVANDPLQATDWKICSPGFARNHESYIIGIPHPMKKMEFFWPVVSQLKYSNRYLPVVLNKKENKALLNSAA